ncbi:MAG: fructose-6-phosphate aldolase [Candidatus Eisenbacteria bacterium]|nr:fructose-6-phosphate aldolase [Candidatus Eisenbacteria bacterium]
MKFFIDTANIKEIRDAKALGVLDGVTTNPTLVAKEKRPFKDVILEICQAVDGPVSVEVVALDSAGMVTQALELSKLHKNVVVKVPLIREGIKAIKELSSKGVKTNATLVFSSNQAILAAKAGATYVSPFIGRLDDSSHVGMDVVREMTLIFRNYSFETEIIVASVRNPLHVIEAAIAGAHIATIPFPVIEQIIKHPLTDAGVKRFLEDWEKVKKLGGELL